MKKLLIASMLGSVAFAGTAFAQTATPAAPADPAMQTEGTMGAETGAMAGEEMMANEGGFVTYQEGSQLLGSGLMGADVRGADGESIGSVDDLLLDRDGQIQAVVVGIGGFLGIGQRDVALANDQLEFVLAQDAAAGTEAGGAMAPAQTGAATVPAAPMGTGATGAATTAPADPATAAATGGTAAATDPAAPGAMGTGTTMAVGEGTYGWTGAGIDHIMVSYTRDQLENAPAFESAE